MTLKAILVNVLFMIINIVFGMKIDQTYLINSILPITAKAYWFLTCYLLLYFIYPYINSALDNIDREKHFSLCATLFFVYFVYVFF